jgi:hypothetical protein
MGVPQELVLSFMKQMSIPAFVETGTFRGGTTFWAANHFKKVITIEINAESSRAVASRPDCPANIEFLVGDSAALMTSVVKSLDCPAVFWLDGHYCGPGTGDIHAECPIMQELEALRQAKEPVILIDDARCFLGPPPPPHKPGQWVTFDEIARFIFMHFPDHFLTVHDDVIIAVPRSLKPALDQNWLENFNRRFLPAPVKRTLIQRIFGRVNRLFHG